MSLRPAVDQGQVDGASVGGGLPDLGLIGAVVIGRNEGERLRPCLLSLIGRVAAVVYVDSGSTDDSVACARSLGATVVELDSSEPFTAARARNAGFARLIQQAPVTAFVQFVDGDCELAPAWVDRAAREFVRQAGVGVVCGRLRERYPDRSIYNRLCDLGWEYPLGEVAYSGGIAMMRVEALRETGGFRSGLVAGEEAELCGRLRLRGWKTLRIDAEMGFHDAAMTRFHQWWKRTVRTGRAYAEGSAVFVGEARSHSLRGAARSVLWGLAAPCISVALLVVAAWWPWAVLGLAAVAGLYLALIVKVLASRVRVGDRPRHAALYAVFCVLGKLPEAQGVIQYCLGDGRRLASRPGAVVRFVGLCAWGVAPLARLGRRLAAPWLRFAHLASLRSRTRGLVPVTTQFEGPVYTSGPVDLVLGEHCRLGRSVFLETVGSGRIVLGSHVRINTGCVLVSYASIRLGDDCLVGEYVSIRDADHGMDTGSPMRSQPHESAPIVIGDNVWIARGAVILQGVTIGRGAVVAANSVVVADVPPNAVVAGAPARVVKVRSAASG